MNINNVKKLDGTRTQSTLRSDLQCIYGGETCEYRQQLWNLDFEFKREPIKAWYLLGETTIVLRKVFSEWRRKTLSQKE